MIVRAILLRFDRPLPKPPVWIIALASILIPDEAERIIRPASMKAAPPLCLAKP
jgi:hypothetical protein